MASGRRSLESIIRAIEDDDVEIFKSLPFEEVEKQLRDIDLLSLGRTQIMTHLAVPSITSATPLHAATWCASHSIMKYILDSREFNGFLNSVTNEGLTPLHLCSITGDFVAADLLSSRRPDVLVKDVRGRIALHYAITTEFLVVIILCGMNANSLIFKDSQGFTPFDLAIRGVDTAMAQFCAVVLYVNNITDLELEVIAIIQALQPQNRRMKTKLIWLPYNVRRPICVSPKTNPTDATLCTCNTYLKDHKAITKNEVLMHRLQCADSDFVDIPTDTFGTLSFQGVTTRSEFVRLNHNTSMAIVNDIFTKAWGLERPDLVLSFYGRHVSDMSVKVVLRNMIWKSCDSAKTWMLTDGSSSSISPMISDPAKEYCDAYGSELACTIGIYPYRKMSHFNNLESENYLGRHTATYSLNPDENGENLDKKISNFLLVDTMDGDIPTSYISFRTKFENMLRKWRHLGSFGYGEGADDIVSADVQICGFIIGGDEDDLHAVYESALNGMPFVVVQNTGGLADIVSNCVRDTAIGQKILRKKAVTEGRQTVDVFELQPINISRIMKSYWEQVKHPEAAVLMIHDLLSRPSKISVCDVHDAELDYHALMLLLDMVTDEDDSIRKLNLPKFLISVALNRDDLAREKVFYEGVKWESSELVPYFMPLLLHDKTEFIKLLIEEGFDLKEFVTRDTLEMLYTRSVHHNRTRNALMKLLRQNTKPKEQITLITVSKLMKSITKNQQYLRYWDTKEESSRNDTQKALEEYPAIYLMTWALTTGHMSMALFLWNIGEEHLMSAVFASFLLRCLMKIATTVSDQEEILEYADDFERKAIGLLTECYFSNAEYAKEILVRERSVFGYSSVLQLAAQSQSKAFISHPCTEDHLSTVWWGNIEPGTPCSSYFVSLVAGVLIPPLVPFSLKFIEHSDSDAEVLPKDSIWGQKSTKTSTMPENIEKERAPAKQMLRVYGKRMIDFYTAPVTCFFLNLASTLAFLFLFVSFLLFNIDPGSVQSTVINALLILWVVTNFIETVRQAIALGKSFREFWGRIWKAIELVAVSLFAVGAMLQFLMLFETEDRSITAPIEPIFTVKKALLRMVNIFYGLSLFLFFYKLMEAFTINMKIGPLVIMVKTMVTHDLFPFLAVFTVALFSFAVLQWAVAFSNTASPDPTVNLRTTLRALRMAYFQIFGEYDLESFEESSSQCANDNINCPDGTSSWLSPILLGIFVILTQALLLNLLIAMFASTYARIQESSVEYWALERYWIILESVERSPAPPPFTFVWYIYRLIIYMWNRCLQQKATKRNPFKISFVHDGSKEAQLRNWENIKYKDYIQFEVLGKKRRGDDVRGAIKSTVITSGIQAPLIRSSGQDEFLKLLTTHSEELEVHKRKLNEIDSKCETILRFLSHSSQQEAELLIDQEVNDIDLPTREAPTNLLGRRVIEEKLQGRERVIEDKLRATETTPTTVFLSPRVKHKLGFFARVNMTKAPWIFESPIPWTEEYNEADTVYWRPSPMLKIDWDESNDYETAVERRECHPMGTDYNAPSYYPPNDPVTKWPRNPAGRTGVSGKGRLPFWGPNPAIILVVTRQSDDNSLEFVVYKSDNFVRLPWFLNCHSKDCDGATCHKKLITSFLDYRLNELIEQDPNNATEYVEIREKLKAAQYRETYSGFLNDEVNTDNAWIEPVVINLHLPSDLSVSPAVLKLLAPDKIDLQWTSLDHISNISPTHEYVLNMTLQYHNDAIKEEDEG